MVFLAFRPQSGNPHVLGRETFLAPVRWDEGAWPAVNGYGTVDLRIDTPTFPLHPFETPADETFFNEAKLVCEWNCLSNPAEENYVLHLKEGYIILKAAPVSLNDEAPATVRGRRQHHMELSAAT